MKRWRTLGCCLLALAWLQPLGALPPGSPDEAQLEKLFAHLNLRYPGLEAVEAAVEGGDLEAAAEALLRYYAGRYQTHPRVESGLRPPDFLVRADNALRDTFTLQAVTAAQPRRADGGLDWKHRGPQQDQEWAWMFNRQRYFLDLVAAWQETHDPVYTDRLRNDLADWVQANPYPDRLTFSAAWRPLEVARRAQESWAVVFETLRHDPLRHGAILLWMLLSLPDHGDALAEHGSFWGGNHLLSEQAALAFLASYWPELLHAERWKEHAITHYTEEIGRQTYPDGTYKELSNHYHRIVLRDAVDFMQLIPEEDPRIRPLRQRVLRMSKALAYVMRPDGTGPLNNGSDLEDNAELVNDVARILGEKRAMWLFFRSSEGQQPPYRSRVLMWSGQAVLRENWGPDSLWAYLDAGPQGTAHQHVDDLHVSLTAGSQDILVDNGRFRYSPDEWKAYFTGPQAHNTLLIDGKTPRPSPRVAIDAPPVLFQRHETWGLVGAARQFPGGAFQSTLWQRRAVLQIHGRFWLVVDSVLGTGVHRIEQRWNFHPSLSTAEAQERVRPLGEAARLRQTWHRGRTAPEIAGFYSPEYNEKFPASQLQASGWMRGNTLLPWLFFPDAATAASVQDARLEPTGRDQWDLVFTNLEGEEERFPVHLQRLAPLGGLGAL